MHGVDRIQTIQTNKSLSLTAAQSSFSKFGSMGIFSTAMAISTKAGFTQLNLEIGFYYSVELENRVLLLS